MFEQFTEKSLKAMELAEQEARAGGYRELGPEHILLGLLREGTGNAAKALQSANVTSKLVRAELQRHQRPTLPSETITYSPAAKELLGSCVRETQLLGSDYISTDYLLLVLLAGDKASNIVASILDRLGVNITTLKEQVQRIILDEQSLYRALPCERPIKRRPVSNEDVYEALVAAMAGIRQRDNSNDAVKVTLQNLYGSFCQAIEIARQNGQFDLVAWLRRSQESLRSKYEERGDSFLALEQSTSDLKTHGWAAELGRLAGALDSQAFNVLTVAKEEALLLGHNRIATEQILLGLIAEPVSNIMVSVSYQGKTSPPKTPLLGADGGVAYKVFKRSGITLDAARREVETIIGHGLDMVTEEPPFSPGTRQVLQAAKQLASQNDPNTERWAGYIGTEHLLLALIRETPDTSNAQDVAQQVMANLGLDLRELEQHVLPLEAESRALLGLRWVGHDIVASAWDEAKNMGHDTIDAEHFLIAVLKHSPPLLNSLQEKRATLEAICAEVERQLGVGSRPTGEDLRFTPRAKRLLELARQESVAVKYCFVGSWDILLALLDASTGLGAAVIEAVGVNPTDWRNELYAKRAKVVKGS